MAKAASPVRLQQDLMDDATLTGKRFSRSASEQVEYWASIGRCVSGIIDPDTLLSVVAGLSRVQVEPVYGQPIDPAGVFRNLQREREHGTLSEKVASARSVKYQVSNTHPGYLECIDMDGHTIIGQFKEGAFVPLAVNE